MRCARQSHLGPICGVMIAVGAALALPMATCQAPPTHWERAGPTSTGMDSLLLSRLRADAAAGTFPGLHAILIAKDGRLVMEDYFAGYDRETLQFSASISKSVGSVLFGIALSQGLVPGASDTTTNVALTELLPEYSELLTGPEKRTLTLDHVLTMSAGLQWDEETWPYSDPRNDWSQASRSDDPVAFTLARDIVATPGSTFEYNGGLSILLSHLIERGSGTPADEFADHHLFGPLDITDYEWERLPGGLTDTDGGLHLRPIDMAKLGQLHLDGGVWRGERVVPEAWVRKSTRMHVFNEGQPDYGFQWWGGDFHFADRSAFTYLASGHGGQKIYVFPGLGIVIVLTHEVFDNPMGELHNNAILARYILPAADPETDRGETIILDASSLARFAGEYDSDAGPIRIVLRDGSLRAEAQGSPPLVLLPLSRTRFRGTALDLLDVEFNFELADDGSVAGLRGRYGFIDTVYRRNRDGV